LREIKTLFSEILVLQSFMLFTFRRGHFPHSLALSSNRRPALKRTCLAEYTTPTRWHRSDGADMSRYACLVLVTSFSSRQLKIPALVPSKTAQQRLKPTEHCSVSRDIQRRMASTKREPIMGHRAEPPTWSRGTAPGQEARGKDL